MSLIFRMNSLSSASCYSHRSKRFSVVDGNWKALSSRVTDRSSFCSVIIQVVDTPYLVHPDWRNFIPGYLYNDPDMDLTAESFYRQSKLISHFFFSVWHISEVVQSYVLCKQHLLEH